MAKPVSPEELVEILQDIDIVVDSIDAELTDEQVAQVCDELGYASLEEARADNAEAEEEEEPEAPVEEEPAPAPETETEAPAED